MKATLNKNCFLTAIATASDGKGRTTLRRKASNHARCNLCERQYRASSSYQRFCRACRSDDELFKFAEWLSET